MVATRDWQRRAALASMYKNFLPRVSRRDTADGSSP